MKTHWLSNPNKNYLGHWDLPDGKDLVVTIKSANWEEVKNPIVNTSEAKRVVRFKEKGIKPLICNETNARSILISTDTKFMEDAEDHKIQLYVSTIRDNRTGDIIDCIRVRTEIKLPELLEKSSEWTMAVEYLKGNKEGLKVIKGKYYLSKSNEGKLCKLAGIK